MATQNSKDEEVYKREYQRMKSLVSSAYVRQTSVSSYWQFWMKFLLFLIIIVNKRKQF